MTYFRIIVQMIRHDFYSSFTSVIDLEIYEIWSRIIQVYFFKVGTEFIQLALSERLSLSLDSYDI